MIYEFIATISAGFALGGIAMIIRHLTKLIFKKQAPKWLIPLFAFIGIMGIQIYLEYNWFIPIQNKMPTTQQVVKTVEGTTWYRPWTYAKPQTVRVMTADIGNMKVDKINANLKYTNLYLYERRMERKFIPQAFDCANNKRADIIENSEPIWFDMDIHDELYKAVCKSKS